MRDRSVNQHGRSESAAREALMTPDDKLESSVARVRRMELDGSQGNADDDDDDVSGLARSDLTG